MNQERKENLFRNAEETKITDELLNNFINFCPDKNEIKEQGLKKAQEQITTDLERLKKAVILDGDRPAIKRTIYIINQINNTYHTKVEYKTLIDFFDKTSLREDGLYSFLQSNLEFLKKNLVSVEEVENKFINIKLDITNTVGYDEIVYATGQLANFKGANFKKIEDSILERLNHAKSTYKKLDENTKNYQDIQYRYIEAFSYAVEFLQAHASKVNHEKFKELFEKGQIDDSKTDKTL